MDNFLFKDTSLEGLKVVERNQIGDTRGHLSKIFCIDKLSSAGWVKPISQVNHTLTKKRGTVRGFHYQHYPYAEMKLVSCLRGRVLDVAIDIRKDSSTFLQWHSEILSQENLVAMLIPEGFAHGFQAPENDSELIYLHSEKYNNLAEGGIRYNDPKLNIHWPLDVIEVSDRDRDHPLITDKFLGI